MSAPKTDLRQRSGALATAPLATDWQLTGNRMDTPGDRRRRERMVRDQLADCPDANVRAAMASVPRHLFLPVGLHAGAYDDCARAIGSGQTISQPRIIARMLAALSVQPGDRVLDVGAGSGYTAALFAQLAHRGSVQAIERQGDLIAATRARLGLLAPSVELIHGDGLATGSTDTFDVIHVAAACAERPLALIARLAPGGRLIAPVGPHAGPQRLLLIIAGTDHWLDEVEFVPGLGGVV